MDLNMELTSRMLSQKGGTIQSARCGPATAVWQSGRWSMVRLCMYGCRQLTDPEETSMKNEVSNGRGNTIRSNPKPQIGRIL